MQLMPAKSDRPKDAGILAIKQELQRRKALKQPLATGGELAEKLEISKQALSKWRRVPSTRAVEIQRLLGIPTHVLRPDVFLSTKSQKLSRRARIVKRSR